MLETCTYYRQISLNKLSTQLESHKYALRMIIKKTTNQIINVNGHDDSQLKKLTFILLGILTDIDP